MLPVTQCEKRSKSKQEPIQGGTVRSCSHITVLSQLTSLNAGSVCSFTEKLAMPSSPFPCLEPPKIQPSSSATPAQQGQKRQNSRKVWLKKTKQNKKPQASTCLYELWSASIPFSFLFCCHLSLKLNNIWSCCHVNQEQTHKVKLSPPCWILAPVTFDGKAQYKRERTGDSFLEM